MGNKYSPFRRLLDYALSDGKLVRAALILLLITTVAEVAGPLLIKRFLDNHVVPANWQLQPIALLAAAYILFMLLAATSNYLQAIRFNLIAQNAVRHLRRQVFDRVMQMPLGEFDRTPTGSLISRITNDTESIKELYVSVIGTAIQNAMRIFGILIAMAVLDWRLMIICLLFVPFVATLVFFYQRLSTPLFHRARALLSDINARLHESFQGMQVIQLLGQEQRFRRDFTRLADDHYRARMSNIRLDSLILRPMVDLLQKLILIGLLFMFGFQSLHGNVEIGVIYAFVTYLGRFAEPLIEFTQRLNLYQQAIVAGERVFTLLDRRYPLPEHDERALIQNGKVEFNAIRFSYDNKNEVIRDVSLTIPSGSFYAIVGHTGSGKSTLAQLLLRFYQPRSGEIRIDDRPLNQYTENELRRRVGIVQQDPFIFNSSVRDNIAMGRNFTDSVVEHAARQAGLHAHVERLPQGYDTIMGERGGILSTGQRQLLALARTLVHRPRLLILDEATANIDSHTEAGIQRTLMQLRGRITLLVIAHRLSTIERADQIIVLHHGQIIQQGNHATLLKDNGVYKYLYELQALGIEDE